jgi:hypothetical protein
VTFLVSETPPLLPAGGGRKLAPPPGALPTVILQLSAWLRTVLLFSRYRDSSTLAEPDKLVFGTVPDVFDDEGVLNRLGLACYEW